MSQSQSGRILVVDDNEVNVDLLTNALERRKHDVIPAMRGREALAILEEDPLPDIILLDINMPEMSGYDVCRELKANERTAEIPVVFISALSETDNIVQGFELGGVDYITKPFKFKEVLARVDMHLQMYWQKKQLEDMRERENQQHAMIDHMRQQFIGSATHDLKNPLQIIAGYLGMLETLESVQADEFAVECVTAMQRGVHKMTGLVGDMLDLIQMEQTGDLLLRDHSFREFLDKNVRDMQIRADEKDIAFAVYLPDEDATIHIEEDKMARVLDNLVSNAIKYTPNGGRVEVVGNVHPNAVTIEVIDNGLGIPDGVLPKLFQPFERVKTEKHLQQEGTGLGLSIVKSIVEKHEGDIVVESALEVGSTFRVFLPRY